MLLGEMIGNLIDNSIAYAGAGAETTVSVRTEGDAVILAVSDSGQGVPPESLPRLLHRFDRLRSDKPVWVSAFQSCMRSQPFSGPRSTSSPVTRRGFASLFASKHPAHRTIAARRD